MKKSTVVFISLTLVLLIVSGIFYFGFDTQTPDYGDETNATIAKMQVLNSHYYRNRLTDERDIRLYEEIEKAALYQIPHFRIKGYEKETINRVAMLVFLDSPFLSISDTYMRFGEEQEDMLSVGRSFILPYFDNVDTQQYYKRVDESIEKAKQIIDKMPKYKTEYEKVKYIHDYIITNVGYEKYDENNTDEQKYFSSAHSALMKGSAQCEGYANAMALLLNVAKIENCMVFYLGEDVGKETAPGHVFTLINTDGLYTYTDATYDATKEKGKKTDIARYDHFMLSEKDLLTYASINPLIKNYLPNCSKNGFFERNGLLFSSYNRKNVAKVTAKELIRQKKASLRGTTIRFKKESDYKKALNSKEFALMLGEIAKQNKYKSTSFSYIRDDDLFTVTIIPAK